jgi:hypothetical protein
MARYLDRNLRNERREASTPSPNNPTSTATAALSDKQLRRTNIAAADGTILAIDLCKYKSVACLAVRVGGERIMHEEPGSIAAGNLG